MLSTMKARIAVVLAVLGIVAAGAVPAAIGGHTTITTITASRSTTAGTTTPTTTVARAMATATSSETKGGRMNAADAMLTNGRFELPPSARGVLVLANPPEAGWRLRALNEEAAVEPAPLAAPTTNPDAIGTPVGADRDEHADRKGDAPRGEHDGAGAPPRPASWRARACCAATMISATS